MRYVEAALVGGAVGLLIVVAFWLIVFAVISIRRR